MTSRNSARRLRVLCLASLLGVGAFTRKAGALASTGVRVDSKTPATTRMTTRLTTRMTTRMTTRLTTRLTTRTTTRLPASAAEPAIPRTPAGSALRAWIEAFNSADTVRLAAYAWHYEPDVVLGDELGFREQTGVSNYSLSNGVVLGTSSSSCVSARVR